MRRAQARLQPFWNSCALLVELSRHCSAQIPHRLARIPYEANVFCLQLPAVIHPVKQQAGQFYIASRFRHFRHWSRRSGGLSAPCVFRQPPSPCLRDFYPGTSWNPHEIEVVPPVLRFA